MQKELLLPLLAGILLLSLFAVSSIHLRESSRNMEQSTLTNTVQKDITSYYAVNGCYPDSLEELREQYPIAFDEDTFRIDYQVRGANLRPDVTVIRKRDEQ